jgi:hypothetical protein
MPPPTLCCRLRLFFLITFASHSLAQVFIPKYLDCPAPLTNATEDSKFRDNIARLVAILPSSAAATGGFASLSRGNGGDQAFIRGLCRGDTNMGDSQTCLQAAGEEVYRNCTTSVRAAIWYEQCFVFFADTNATTAYEESYRQELQNVNSVSNKAAFERTYGELMSSLATGVVGSADVRDRARHVRPERSQRHHVRAGAVHEGPHGEGVRAPGKGCARLQLLPACGGLHLL